MKPDRVTTLLSAAVLAAALIPQTGNGASLVEIRSEGDTTRLYVDGRRGRMEPGGDDGYVLYDQSSGKLVMVMPGEGRAMDMSSMLQRTATPGPAATLTPAGNGPTIAGYATERYKYAISGTPCGTVYVSNRALQDSGAGIFMEVMERMAQSTASFRGPGGDPCERGGGAIPQALKDLGLPMRVEDAHGRLESEITAVNTRATLPPNAFGIPDGVRVEDVAAMQAMASQQASQMQEMMQQLEQSGQMPPELLEQMRKAREQYGR